MIRERLFGQALFVPVLQEELPLSAIGTRRVEVEGSILQDENNENIIFVNSFPNKILLLS